MDFLSALRLSQKFNFICLLKDGAVPIAARESLSQADSGAHRGRWGTELGVWCLPARGSWNSACSTCACDGLPGAVTSSTPGSEQLLRANCTNWLLLLCCQEMKSAWRRNMDSKRDVCFCFTVSRSFAFCGFRKRAGETRPEVTGVDLVQPSGPGKAISATTRQKCHTNAPYLYAHAD